MNIATAIENLSVRIQESFDALKSKGFNIPDYRSTYTLKTAIEAIKSINSYTRIKYSNGVEGLFDISGTLYSDLVPNLSDAIDIQIGDDIVDIEVEALSNCSKLTNFTIHGKTWRDVVDNAYWGIPNPNIMHGDWDKYVNFANAQIATAMLKLSAIGSPPEIDILSSSDATDGSWQQYDLTSDIQLASYGDRVFLKAADANMRLGSSSNDYWKFSMSGDIDAAGNIMSLLDAESKISSIAGKPYCFNRLFYDCRTLISPPQLPAIELSEYCYNGLFYNCIKLMYSPELPAKKLAEYCYRAMFTACNKLQKAPDLIAEVPYTGCYFYMFNLCKSLASAKIKLQNLVYQCCYSMFNGCNKISSLSVEFTQWNPSNATVNWLNNAGISATNPTFICPEELDTSILDASHIPSNWNIIKI